MKEKVKRSLDPRIDLITDLVIRYSMGDFTAKLYPAGEYDEVDAFMTIMNMVGEEMQASTISRNYFNNIFHSVSDMIFVMDLSGEIQNVNKAVINQLGFSESSIRQKFPDQVMAGGKKAFNNLLSTLEGDTLRADQECYFYTMDGRPVPVFCSSSYLINRQQEKIGYLLLARDLTKIHKYERSLQESEEKYKRIFDESSDTIFVINPEGYFQDLNKAGGLLIKLGSQRANQYKIFDLFVDETRREQFRNELSTRGLVVDFRIRLKDLEGNIHACLISASKINNDSGDVNAYQGMIKDISQQKTMENLVIRTIVDTQEKERKRFAMDLHDSLGQQLSAIKFYLATLRSIYGFSDPKSADILVKSNDALDRVLAELRNICFNLMPGTLQSFGLKHALQELCKKIEHDSLLKFDLHMDNAIPLLAKSLDIAIFRITQEFINNAVVHGHAKKVSILMSLINDRNEGEQLRIVLADDGDGFCIKNLEEGKGMGLKNVRSRVESYNGEIRISSEPGKGTRYDIVIPNPRS
jgi:PAS domain S-box-containing protein